jgi:hypothetical protein
MEGVVHIMMINHNFPSTEPCFFFLYQWEYYNQRSNIVADMLAIIKRAKAGPKLKRVISHIVDAVLSIINRK